MSYIEDVLSALGIGYFILAVLVSLLALVIGIFGLVTTFMVNPILGVVVLILAMVLPPLGVVNILQGALLLLFNINLAEQFMKLIGG